MTKRKIEYWVIPPEGDGEFVANMEEVLETYEAVIFQRAPAECAPNHFSYLRKLAQHHQNGGAAVPPVLFDYLADGLPSMQPFLWPSKSTWSVITQVVLLARSASSCPCRWPSVSHHVDEVPGQDTKYSPRKLTALVFCEKTLEILGFAAVNFRGEFSSPIRGGRLAIRNSWAFSLDVSGLSLPLRRRVPHQLSLELMPKAALFGPAWHPSDRLKVAQRDRVAAGLARWQKEISA